MTIEMRRTAAGEFGDELPEPDAPPGTFAWRTHAATAYSPGGRYLVYICPRGNGYCGVPIQPNVLPNGAGWTHDGNDDRPTLSPSVNCVSALPDGKPSSGCGWHGHVIAGEMREV